jgi:DNA-binding beta-propeller fold protein YncE
VSVIEGATTKAIATFNVDSYPVAVAADTIYVTSYNSNTLSAISPPFATLPGAPTIGTAAAGHGQATVAFGAPSDCGGVAIRSLTVAATD